MTRHSQKGAIRRGAQAAGINSQQGRRGSFLAAFFLPFYLTERGNINREIGLSNKELRQTKARIIELQDWLKKETANTEPPTLADVIEGILTRDIDIKGKDALQRLKAAANIVNFLTVHEVMDMAGLDDCFRAMIDKQIEIRDKLKPIDRKLATLDKHLEQSENYKSYRGKLTQYRKLQAAHQAAKNEKGFGTKKKAEKAQAAADSYYNDNSREIILCEAAETYLKGVLQKRFDPNRLPPITKWTQDRANVLAEKK